MFYYDGTTNHLSHFTYINDRKVMESVSSPASTERKYYTNYHGGVFFLNTTDHVSVQIPFTHLLYRMDSKASFFGAFLLHSV